MRHDGIREATIAIIIKFSSTTIVLHAEINKSLNSTLYFHLFQVFHTKWPNSTTPVSNRKLNPTRRNEKSSSTWWGGEMYCAALTFLIQYGIRRRVDREFSSDFHQNKAVKFNSGQYMNNTLEGAPFYRVAYLTGWPLLRNIRYLSIYLCPS